MHTKNHVLCFLEAARDLCRFYPLEEKPNGLLPPERLDAHVCGPFPALFRAPIWARAA
jgi:hypothetical protein